MKCPKCNGTMEKIRTEFKVTSYWSGGFCYEDQTWKCKECGYEVILSFGASD